MKNQRYNPRRSALDICMWIIRHGTERQAGRAVGALIRYLFVWRAK